MARSLYPSILYRDAPAAINWLVRVFRFDKGLVVPGPDDLVAHAELVWGEGIVLSGSKTTNRDGRPELAVGPAYTYVQVDDVVAHHAHAAGEGAEIVQPVLDGPSGLNYLARDLEGNVWAFGSYRPGQPLPAS